MNLGVEKFKINYKSREFWKNSFARVSPGGFTRHLKRFTRSKSKSKPYIINDDEATKKKLRKEKENNKDILYKTHDLIAQSHSTQKISPLTQKNTNISQDMILQPKDSNKNVPATQREVGKQNLPPKPPVGGKLNDTTIIMLKRKKSNHNYYGSSHQLRRGDTKSVGTLDNSQIVGAESPSTKIEDFKLLHSLGKGSYAVVKLANHLRSSKQVAIKIYEKKNLYDPLKKASVEREIKLMRRLHHRNIIKYINDFSTTSQIHLVMEYVGSRSLYEYVKSGKNRHLKEHEAMQPFRQLCEGISYIHARNIFHRDLKLENVLYPEGGDIKLIDFGFSVHSKSKLKTFCGTPTYMAPEIVKKREYLGSKVDIWALGIMLYRILTGTYPFTAKKDKELYRRIYEGKYDDSLLPSPEAKDMIKKMLAVRSEDRISIDDILKHSWFLPKFVQVKSCDSAEFSIH